jgi:integrase
MYDKLKTEIKKFNQKSSFKIKYRKLKNHYSLFLEIQKNNLRQYINLDDYFVKGLPSTFSSDKKIVFKASEKQRVYNKQYELNEDTFLRNIKLKSSNVILFFESIRDTKSSKSTKKSWNNVINQFRAFTNNRVIFKDIDLKFCEKFKTFLLKRVSVNTTATYYSLFKAMLNYAVKYDIINKNPARFVSTPKKQIDREFLVFDEIKLLKSTESVFSHISNAFLFSCFTGLRISDVRSLKWSNISSSTLSFTQQKTGIIQRIKISKSAIQILDQQRSITSKSAVFEIPKSDSNVNKHLREWVKRAGITKHITFHCSRHTFATLCLTSDIDLYTVSKLLGHTDIKNTQIYAKLIDKKKDEAIDKLPVF